LSPYNVSVFTIAFKTVALQGGIGYNKNALEGNMRKYISREETAMEPRIIHKVIFCLKYDKSAPETEKFLSDGRAILTSIPVVRNFEVFQQISPKNDYDFGFSMEFENREAYEAYNIHPLHVDFVEQRWKQEVTRFLEIDCRRIGDTENR
jgi:hypothetical protein